MNRKVVQRILIGLTIVLMSGLASGVFASERRTARVSPSAQAEEATPSRPFKLRAAGQIDISTGTIMFGGVASHLGLYTATGFLNPDFSIVGTITAANGDTLNFTAVFSTGPMGEIAATFEVAGGSGRFAGSVGTASGPVAIDFTDFTFLTSVIGNLEY